MKKYLFILPLLTLVSCGRDRDDDCGCKKITYKRENRVGYVSRYGKWEKTGEINIGCATPTNEIDVKSIKPEGKNIIIHHGEQIICK